MCDPLEPRRFLTTVTLTGGGPFLITSDIVGQYAYFSEDGSEAHTPVPLADLDAISVSNTSGNVHLALDFTYANVTPDGLTFTTGSTGNVLSVRGRMAAGTLTLSGSGAVSLDAADPYALENTSLAVAGSGGSLTLSTTHRFNAVSISSGARLTLTPGGGKVLVTRSLSIAENTATPPAPLGALDLNDNDLIVDYPSSSPSPLATVTRYLASGRNSGSSGPWTGLGITSSSAADSAFQDYTALGVAEASALSLSCFDYQPVDATCVLVRYTYVGNATLSGGAPNSTDSTRLNSGYADNSVNHTNSLHGWVNGDFDYSGTIDADDLSLYDRTSSGMSSNAPSGWVSFMDPASSYYLTLPSTILPVGTATAWTIDWGDGATSYLAGAPYDFEHVYNPSGGAGLRAIIATAHHNSTTYQYAPLRFYIQPLDGDTDLDGKVDAADFFNVNRSIAAYAKLDPSDRPAYAAWHYGDFDYDADIDKDDMALMVASFNSLRNAHFNALTGTNHNRTINSSTSLLDIYAHLDALHANGGGTLTVDGTINLGSAGLLLSGYSNIRIRPHPTNGGGFTLSSTPTSGASVLKVNNCSNLFIQGLDIDGNDYLVHGIAVLDSDHVTLDNNTIHDLSDNEPTVLTAGIWALGNENNHYTNNTIQDLDGYGIRAGHSTDMPGYTRHTSQREDAPVIAGNTIYNTGGDGIIGHYPYALIAGNDIDLADSNGDPAGHTGIGISSTGEQYPNNEHDVVSHDVVVLDNIINGAGWHGIQSDVALDAYTLNCTIIDNEITNTAGIGIFMLAVKGWTVSGNVISAAGGAGIFLSRGGSNTTISFNAVDYCGAIPDNGIHYGGIYVRIDDNAYAIHCVDYLSIINNTVTNNNGWGISFSDAIAYVDQQSVPQWGIGSNFLIANNACSDNYVGSTAADLLVRGHDGNLDISLDDIYGNTGVSDIVIT